MLATKRLIREIKNISTKPIYGVEINSEDIRNWKVEIKGPGNTPYRNGIFKVDIEFGDGYPFDSPVVNFVTKIYHPNINLKGNICIGVLGPDWLPSHTAKTIITKIIHILENPDIDNPLVPEVANVIKHNKEEYAIKAEAWTSSYAY